MRSLSRLLALLLAAALIAAACGNDDDGGSAASETSASTDEASSETSDNSDEATPEPTEAGADEAAADEESEAGADAPAERPTVRVGSVNSLTGPVPFPEASAAAAAVFDRYNDDPAGVVTIEYIAEDDMADPAIAAQAARKLVTEDEVVMMAGAASLVDCAVNGGLYVESGIYAVQGTGVDETCFVTSNIAPINTGPYAGLTASLYYGSEVLGHDSICYFQFDAGTPTGPTEAAIDRWTAITGKSLTTFDYYTPGDDFTPFVNKAVEDGCTAVFEGGLDSTAIAFDAAVAAQGAPFDVLHFTSAYTAAAADAIGTPAADTYANSEFEPFTDLDSPALADWVDVMTDAGVPLTSFGQGGYLAALATIQILESAGLAAGDDTATQRAKVEAAVLAMEPFEHAMLGSAYVFGEGEAHNPNQASKFVQLVDGAWVSVTDDFIVLTDLE